MGLGPQASLSVWAVSDGRVGIENQALGLAEAVARLSRLPGQQMVKRIGWRWPFDRLPTGLNPGAPGLLTKASDPIEAPWPDLWIAAGRASLPLSLRIKRWSGGKTFVVQLQDPRWPPSKFDLVIPPLHDGLTGPNVFPIIGSPNRITPKRLAEGLQSFWSRLEALPKGRRIAVLIGGSTRGATLSAEHAAALGDKIAAAAKRERATLLVTFSRRTPPEARIALTQKLTGLGWIWDGKGDNPYSAFLAAADLVLVTEDSVNMATDAATAGKPVLVLPVDGVSPRIKRFHQALAERGAARAFDGPLTAWPVEPLRETERAAAEVLKRMGIVRS